MREQHTQTTDAEGEETARDAAAYPFDFSEYARREAESVPFPGASAAICRNCGSQVAFDERATATVCPLCGSAHIATDRQKTGIPPESVIPFQVDRQAAVQKFREWVKGLRFAPSMLKESYQEERLTGRFVPFWAFAASAAATYTGEGGRTHRVTDKDGKDQTVTDWYPTSGLVQHDFNNVLASASTSDSARDADLVGPFDMVHGPRPYAAKYLVGYQAELYSVKADAGFETAKSEMETELRNLAEADIRARFDTVRSVQISPQYSAVTYRHVLLPVWSSVFAYGGKPYRYVINGATGKVYGQRPYSILKILLTILAALALVLGVCTRF